MERADEWAHRAWMGAYVELQEGVLDDASWLALCRAHQRFGPMA